MDDARLKELERLRAEALELCEKSRRLAESVVALIDDEMRAEAVGSHRRPRRKYRHLWVVKGLITGAAGLLALRKLAGVAAASAVTAAAVSVLVVPAVTAPAVPGPQVTPGQVTPTVPSARPTPGVVRSHQPAPSVTGPASAVSSAPVASPSPSVLPLPSVPLPSPSVPVPSASSTCSGVVVLGVCIPFGQDIDHDGDSA